MTYKDLMYEELAKKHRFHGNALVPGKEKQALAYEVIDTAVIQQFFWSAILNFQGDLDAMGRGIYLYWNESGAIIDIATVPLDECGDPPTGSAPVAHLLEEFKIPHAVGPYRFGGTDWLSWREAQNMMQEVAEKARQWVKEFAEPVFDS